MKYEVKSPMPATVLEVLVTTGEKVSEKTIVATLESMKMEMPIFADVDGTVTSISASPNTTVPKGGVLVIIE
ncbi:acetyl-CoA carboxylase biotin carboxyl carrier protein subunit [Anoxybacterium hadale]|uniref:Acetyl-CoA carboxylase biotin carboxyl carrier protein subunit n=1 Tax=Anoxybacterium hadale TaxID=3408580 RepID=A0ACD1A774_9FIRM|nr:acetyl-CoA carboxylase biotin carboxyl carrier protein subunit [Clostridiales bacterium]